jgi:hypothetical protein
MFRAIHSLLLRFILGKSYRDGGGSQQPLNIVLMSHSFVLTDMGIAAATGAGIDLPETSDAEAANKIIDVISSATRESTSGKFLDVDTREVIPW